MHASVLRYLEEVARSGSIRKASRRLNVASSAVNRQILKLEAELGTPLFERMPSGLRPTPAGDLVLRHARDTMHDFQRLLSEINALQGAKMGLVRIASLDSLMIHFLPRAIERFHQSYPLVTFKVDQAGPGEIANLVADGQADIGLSFDLEGHAGVRIADEIATPVMAVMAPGHPLAGRRRLTLRECASYPLMLQQVIRPIYTMLETGLASEAVRPFLTSNSMPLVKHMIRRSLGIAFYTQLGFLEELARGEVVAVPLSHKHLANLRLALLLPVRREPTVAVAAMINQLREAFADLRGRDDNSARSAPAGRRGRQRKMEQRP